MAKAKLIRTTESRLVPLGEFRTVEAAVKAAARKHWLRWWQYCILHDGKLLQPGVNLCTRSILGE